MVRTQIQLTEGQVKTLKRLAHSRHLSVAELIRQAVESLIRSNSIADIDERRRRALSIVGKFRSGKRDISREHDKYLAEDLQK
ncbi:MAG: ribbon-helix-helix protein, CopG family [Thermodesulfovibrionales bacterium]|jgi:predicted DNA-binding ribbon-helix-helix protein